MVKSVDYLVKQIKSRTIESNSVRPEGEDPTQRYYAWKLYPVPIYGEHIRNNKMRAYAITMLNVAQDMMFHGDNEVLEKTLTVPFRDEMLMHMESLYSMIAVDHLNVEPEVAFAADFKITNEHIIAYKPEENLPKILTEDHRPLNPAHQYTSAQFQTVLQGVMAPDLPPKMNPFPNSVSSATNLSGPPKSVASGGNKTNAGGNKTKSGGGKVNQKTPTV